MFLDSVLGVFLIHVSRLKDKSRVRGDFLHNFR